MIANLSDALSEIGRLAQLVEIGANANSTLRETIEELGRDKERLDWLDVQPEDGPPRIDVILGLWWRGPDEMTARGAIDAARKEEES